MSYPFTSRVQTLNERGKRFYDMQRECNEARSSAWWNKVANGVWVTPPPRDRLDDIAVMMGVTKRRVQEMVAEEWYDVRPGDGISERVRHLAAAIDELDEPDAQFVEQLIHRLRQQSGTDAAAEGEAT